jgi:alkyl sulfatase BDS1-like metallo-beta-lactamase superfamily hydrolase
MSGSAEGRNDPRAGASEATLAVNAAMAAELDFSDRRDFDEAARGLIAPLPDGGKVVGEDGGPIWDLSRFDFVTHGGEAPDTVNPSL